MAAYRSWLPHFSKRIIQWFHIRTNKNSIAIAIRKPAYRATNFHRALSGGRSGLVWVRLA